MRQILGVVALAVCVVAVCWSQAAADWDPGDPAKWVQLPDLTATGMDIWHGANYYMAIADDYLCTSTDPLTDFHFWGSWLNDVPGTIDAVSIIIKTDDPSMLPGDVGPAVYLVTVTPTGGGTPYIGPIVGTFTEQVYYTLTEGHESYYDPYSGGAIIGTDTVVYQYNIDIPEENAFIQEGTPENPVTYWFQVMVHFATANTNWGWKTRDPAEHYGNDAYYSDTDLGGFYPLVYPAGHPLAGQSIDMAFVITPEPATIALMALGTLGTLLLRRKRR